MSPVSPTLALKSPDSGVALLSAPDNNGYAIISATGGQYNYGSSRFSGSLAGRNLNAPIVDAAVVPSVADAKWFLASDGGVFTLGKAQFFGSMGGKTLNAPMTAIIPSHTGNGYLLVAKDGGTFAFGDFPPTGSLANLRLNAPIVDAVSTPDDRGVWLVATDGGVFALGTAQFFGSMGGKTLNAPMTAIVLSLASKGYLLVAEDGGTFAFGDYTFPGSMAGKPLNAKIVDATVAGDQGGVWLLGEDGGVFPLTAPFYGSAANEANNGPTVYTSPQTVAQGGQGGLVAIPCEGGGEIIVAVQIAQGVRDLLGTAKAAGYNKLCDAGPRSSYRSTQDQIVLRKRHCGTSEYEIYRKPSGECRPATAIPGTSNHEKGLAIDFNVGSVPGSATWLKENAPKYGLKLCASCKEPWHFSTNGR